MRHAEWHVAVGIYTEIMKTVREIELKLKEYQFYSYRFWNNQHISGNLSHKNK